MRRYLLILFIPALAFCGILVPASIYYQPIDGDLTRTGRWSERDFGGNAPQPSIQLLAGMNEASAPDMLVLGDSFSRDLIWQSMLAPQRGITIVTDRFDYVDCIANWVQQAATQETAKWIVIETVEREFLRRFGRVEACEKKPNRPIHVTETATPTQRETGWTWPKHASASYLWRTARNTAWMNRQDADYLTHGQTANVRIDPVCGNFSNKRNDRMLYLREDEETSTWDKTDIDAAITNVLRIQRLLETHGKRLIFLVVPNKLAVYQECLRTVRPKVPVDLNQQLQAAGVHTTDLTTVFRDARHFTVDLYKPNDSHFSATGYEVLAKIIDKLTL